MKTLLASGYDRERSLQGDAKARWSFADMHSSCLAWVILGLSAIITIAAWHISNDSMVRESETRFQFNVEDIRSAIEKRMHEQTAALWGGVGLFKASDRVSRTEWRRYYKTLKTEKFLPGLQGYGYAEIVLPRDKEAHIRRVRSEGFPDFDIRPAGNRELYSSIIYLEPFIDRNLRAFGYDMFSETTRRTAMKRARDTGEAAVSGMVTLVQETGKDVQRGFLMYLPVYRAGMPVSTVEERRAALQGFVYSPFRIKDLMRGILGKANTAIDFRIYDGSAKSAERLLYDSADNDASYTDIGISLFNATDTLQIGGHPWTLEFRTRPGFISPGEQNEPLYIAAGGILIDILLFLTISSLMSQRRRALSLANQMTGELRSAKEKAEQSEKNEIALRTAAQESNKKLKTANDGLLKFTSIVAHDLRAPLKRVESFIGILQQDYDKKLDEEGKDILVRIGRGSSRMRLMLDSLHNYAKYSDVSIKGKTTSIAAVLKNALETLGTEAGDAKIEIDIEKDCQVSGDTMLLGHVAQNLISNSVKFRGNSRPDISIVVRRVANDMVEMAASDDGIGIEPEHADKVFDMFARLHNEDEYEGTGIGLAVCRKIVGDHGGHICIDTTQRKGTRIVITLQQAGVMKEPGFLTGGDAPRAHVAAGA